MAEVKGFIPVSFLDWPGKVAAVLFLPRCNFRCPFCHNHELCEKPELFPTIPTDWLMKKLEALKGWIDGVCVSGGEPTVSEGLGELVSAIRELGLGVKLDTNGSRPEVLERLASRGLLDHVAVDIKAPLEESSYSRAAGVKVDPQRIVETLTVLKKHGTGITVRMTVVPGLHTEEDVVRAALAVRRFGRLRLQRFDPRNAADPQLRSLEPHSEEEFERLERRVEDALQSSPETS